MTLNYNIERDLKEAEAMVAALEDYIHSDQLYLRVHGGGLSGAMPNMTIGSLLMRLRRLDILRDGLSAEQRQRLENSLNQNEAFAKEWRLHYSGKMIREAKSRLDAMRTFFQECRETPRACAGIYGPEALRRTIVQEILLAMKDLGIEVDDDLKTKRGMIDQQLRGVLVNTDFIWADEIQSAYPREKFWWLYQSPIEAA